MNIHGNALPIQRLDKHLSPTQLDRHVPAGYRNLTKFNFKNLDASREIYVLCMREKLSRRVGKPKICIGENKGACPHWILYPGHCFLVQPGLCRTWLETITKTCPCNIQRIFFFFFGCKNENFQCTNLDIFLIFAQDIDCGYMLKPPRQGGSNENPKFLFRSKNKKNIIYEKYNI